MKGIRLIAMGRALPKQRVDNHRMSEMVETNDEWIQTRTGIKNRYICEEESCVSLAIEAGRQALERSQINPNRIGAVIVATATSDYVFPSAACMVAKGLMLHQDIMSFDLSAACTGFLYGLEMSRGYLATHEDKYVLLIGAEQLSRIVDYTDRSTCILFGDGAGAAILAASDREYFQVHGTDTNDTALYCNGPGKKEQFIHMKGNDVFRFAVTTLKKTIDQVLEGQGITLDDVDHVVCHQANARIIDHVKKKYKGYEDKFVINIEKYGNTSAASIPIVLSELYDSGKLEPGTRILSVGFGAGLTWSGVYFTV